MRVAFYVTATGEIDYIFGYPPEASIPADIDADLESGYSWKEIPLAQLATVGMETHYVSGGNFVLRPTVYPADIAKIKTGGGVDGTLEFAVPNGTVIFSHHHGEEYALGAENFTFTTQRVGEWSFDIDPPFPYRPSTLTVIAYVD